MGHPGSLDGVRERSGKRIAGKPSGLAVDFGPPPADADEEESPVAEEFGRLAFEGVADELEDPSEDEQRQGIEPQAMKEESGDRDCDREQNRGNAEGVANAIDRVLVAAGVLRDPCSLLRLPSMRGDHTT